MRHHVVVRVFYCLIAILSLLCFPILHVRIASMTTDTLSIASWVAYFDTESRHLILNALIGISTVGSLFGALFGSTVEPRRKRLVAIAAFVSFSILITIRNSFGSSANDLYSAMLAMGWLAIGSSISLRGAQASVALTYFLSGLWKARMYVQQISEFGWDAVHPTGASLAWVLLETNRAIHFPEWVIGATLIPVIAHLLWLLLIIFECGLLLMVLSAADACPERRRRVAVAGAAIALFHIAAGEVLGIAFDAAALVAIVILALPYLLHRISGRFSKSIESA